MSVIYFRIKYDGTFPPYTNIQEHTKLTITQAPFVVPTVTLSAEHAGDNMQKTSTQDDLKSSHHSKKLLVPRDSGYLSRGNTFTSEDSFEINVSACESTVKD